MRTFKRLLILLSIGIFLLYPNYFNDYFLFEFKLLSKDERSASKIFYTYLGNDEFYFEDEMIKALASGIIKIGLDYVLIKGEIYEFYYFLNCTNCHNYDYLERGDLISQGSKVEIRIFKDQKKVDYLNYLEG